jgi:4-hydroxy-3-methylbut-2-enyl diphosphate reductase
VGLLGFAPDAIVVDEEEDWQRIPRRKRMALLTQSTQPPWKFERLAAYLVSRAHELKIVNTVCPVTIRRQEDTTELARSVDLVVVVGGRNSANTRELTRLVGIVGRPAMQVERAADLVDSAAFDGATVVGVTGGTSTPIEDLESVARRIYELAGTADRRERAVELAHAAVTEVAEPAYRSTSLSLA